MIFTSYTYLLFLLAVFFIHWLLPTRARKPFLVIASYLFYCTWKWQYGFLLLGVSLFNWTYARWVLARVGTMPALIVGIIVNLVPLLYFKYTNFLLGNFAAVAHLVKWQWQAPGWNIILPLGISFFTFQGIAYLFDVAAGEEPLDYLLDFLLFKAFWPQLIAGPIVRLSEMREQILIPRTLDYSDVAEGSQRILFGFFKKVALADNIAPSVEMVFSSAASPNSLDSLTGMIGFGMQIYFDFSGYSDIAIGTARLFGFRFPENFNWPYISRNPREFWNRWHITLSTWIRDYLFTPMSFASRRRPALMPIWLLLAMALCGLWHGAAWTFVLWGVWHGLLLVANATPLKKLFFAPSALEKPDLPWWHAVWGVVCTFVLVDFGWLLFRARSFHQAAGMLHSILVLRGHLRPAIVRENNVLFVAAIFAGLIVAELFRAPLERLRGSQPPPWYQSLRLLRPIAYAALIVIIIVADQESQAFVYFQF